MPNPPTSPAAREALTLLRIAETTYRDTAPPYWQAIDERDAAIARAYELGLSYNAIAEALDADPRNVRRAADRHQKKIVARGSFRGKDVAQQLVPRQTGNFERAMERQRDWQDKKDAIVKWKRRARQGVKADGTARSAREAAKDGRTVVGGSEG